MLISQKLLSQDGWASDLLIDRRCFVLLAVFFIVSTCFPCPFSYIPLPVSIYPTVFWMLPLLNAFSTILSQGLSEQYTMVSRCHQTLQTENSFKTTSIDVSCLPKVKKPKLSWFVHRYEWCNSTSLLSFATQTVGCRPAALILPGILLEMQNLGPHKICWIRNYISTRFLVVPYVH